MDAHVRRCRKLGKIRTAFVIYSLNRLKIFQLKNAIGSVALTAIPAVSSPLLIHPQNRHITIQHLGSRENASIIRIITC